MNPNTITEPDEDAIQQEALTEEPAWVRLLQADTPTEEVHQRAALNRAGQPVLVNGQPLMLDYVTARFVQDRLDTAVGPLNWQTLFESLASGAVRCGIGIRPPGTDEWVWKWDVGVPSNIEPDKGAHSDAFKRAGVQWGIGRDLYDDRDEKAIQSQPGQAPVQQQAQPQTTIREQVQPQQTQPVQQQQTFAGDGQIVEYDEEATGQTMGTLAARWVCPIHNDVREVPAGISKRSNKPYNAFLACPVQGCTQKEPFRR